MLLSTGEGAARRVTPAHARSRLAAHTPAGGGAWPSGLTRAAVLISLVTHAEEMTVIFTRRTAHLADHAGQISFPGGRIERADRDPVMTALREAEDEIGLAGDRVEVLGCLDVCDTSTGFAVAPVVGLVEPPLALALDANEVAEAFEVPVSFLMEPANRRRELRRRGGRVREVTVIDYRGRAIWGATARMAVDLCEVLSGK